MKEICDYALLMRYFAAHYNNYLFIYYYYNRAPDKTQCGEMD